MSGENNGNGNAPQQKILSREELDEVTSGKPQTPAGIPGVRMLSPCHQAPLFAVYLHNSGKLLLQCAWCGQAPVGILVGRASILHLPSRRIGG